MDYIEINVKSTIDGGMQPSLFFENKGGKRPLLVGLHTWSWDRFNQVENFSPLAEKYGFHLLLPDFRGSNLTTNPNCTDACGSLKAKQDIKDAIDYCIENFEIDTDNIFLLGGSGGGHMSLLMAGYCPEVFKAVASFVPITDLEKWNVQNPKYSPHILACCSNNKQEMAARSPKTYIDKIATANVKIFHGKFDNVVPYTQSLEFYNEIFKKYPNSKVYLDIFEGGHQLDKDAAMYWFMSQYKKEKQNDLTG